jgi:putative acetyltransferase
MGIGQDNIEALFIDPEYLRLGGGATLIWHARRLLRRALRVNVNEQNEIAVRFYEANGFTVVGRSPVDDGGRPYPVLQMR